MKVAVAGHALVGLASRGALPGPIVVEGLATVAFRAGRVVPTVTHQTVVSVAHATRRVAIALAAAANLQVRYCIVIGVASQLRVIFVLVAKRVQAAESHADVCGGDPVLQHRRVGFSQTGGFFGLLLPKQFILKVKLTFSNFIYKPKEKISRSRADNQSCKMSVLPGIIVLGGTILMCLVCLLASRRNNTCSFSYRNTNNVYVHRPQVIIENTVFSSGQDLPLDCSREIQPYKKEN